MGNIVLRKCYTEKELQSHLVRRVDEDKQVERAIEQLTLNKICFDDVKIKMEKMQKTLEILINDSRLKDVVEREVERLNELRLASEKFKKINNL